MVNWLDEMPAFMEKYKREHPEEYQRLQDEQDQQQGTAPLTPLQPLPDPNPKRGFHGGVESGVGPASPNPLGMPGTTPPPSSGDMPSWPSGIGPQQPPDNAPLDPGWAQDWQKFWQQQQPKPQMNIPPPPPTPGSPFPGRRIDASAGLLGGNLGALLGQGGGQGLLGGAGNDTFDLTAPPAYPSDMEKGLAPLPFPPLGDTPTGDLTAQALQAPHNIRGGGGGYTEMDAPGLLGSSGADTLGGGSMDTLGVGGAAPADDGSNPNFFSRLFGGGKGGSDWGPALMQLGGGIAAGATEGWGAGIGKGLGLAGASLQRSKEQRKQEEYQKAALAERAREHEESMQLEREKLNKPDLTDDEQEYNRAVAQGFKGGFMDYVTSIKKAGAQNINIGPEGGNYGKPPENRSWVYETPRDEQGNPTGPPQVKMEPVPGGGGAQRPMSVPLEGSPEDKAIKAKSDMTRTLGDMGKGYQELDKMGAIPNPDRTPAENVGAAARSSGVGQSVGQATGDPAASVRQRILNKRPLLINHIRQITGMGAKSMDSNTELNFYMQMTSDPHKDVWSNYAALDQLDQQFGDGTWLENQGFDDNTKARIRNAGFELQKQAPPPGFKQPKEWTEGAEVWAELPPAVQQRWIDSH